VGDADPLETEMRGTECTKGKGDAPWEEGRNGPDGSPVGKPSGSPGPRFYTHTRTRNARSFFLSFYFYFALKI